MQRHLPDHLEHDSLPSGQNKAADGSTSASAAPLATQPLVACVYIALQCPRCGDVRQTRHKPPAAESIPCPQCGTDCPHVFLGKGFTSRKLPFSETRHGEPQLLHRRDEVPEISSPGPCRSG